jgi:competence protein ComEA
MRFPTCCLIAVFAAIPGLAQQPQFPDGPGKDVFLRICSTCHGPQVVSGRGNTEDGWTQVVVNMVQRGAQGTDDEFAQIVDYLAKNFPPKTAVAKVNVNKASAEELKTGLELTPKEAEAIVSYREHNGQFKSIEQVEKVPGVDSGKIEAKKDRVTF